MMNKKGKIVLAIIILAAIALTLYFVLKKDTIHTAMNHYDDSDYDSAIVIFNTLLPKAKEPSRERMYFYRCRSMDKLIVKLNDKYEDELNDLVKYHKNNREDYRETHGWLKKKIRNINLTINGDLYLISVPGKPNIAGQDKYCKELEEKYPQSPFVIEYKYERILLQIHSSNHNALKTALTFYKTYKDSPRGKEILEKIRVMVKEQENIDSSLFEDLTNILKNRVYTCKKDRVNLRTKPNLKASVAAKGVKGETFLMIRKSTGKTTLGDRSFYWYNVMRKDGSRAWIYGSLIEKVEKKEKEEELKSDKVESKKL